VSVSVAWHTSGVKTFDDARTKGLTIGGNGPNMILFNFPACSTRYSAPKFQVISGYPGRNDVLLTRQSARPLRLVMVERKDRHQAWIDDKKINVLIQLSLAKHPDLPDVPLITDFATSEEQKQIRKLIFGRQVMGRPFPAPPGVPPIARKPYAVRSWIP
jgi:hypothetical protein